MAPDNKTSELPFVSAELLPVDLGHSTRALAVDGEAAPPAAAPATAASPAAAPTATDARIGSYQIVSRMGQGALGESWRCRDPELNREVVVKLLRAELAGDAAMQQRFVRSARAMAKADAPELATVFHVGEHEGRPFVAVEKLDGQDLQTRLDQGGLDLRGALRLVERAATALDRLQQRGLCHGNLKPSNLFVSDDAVRLTDAGMAGVAAEPAPDAPYRAPERTDEGEPTAQTDVYALGAILFRCAVGGPPASERPAEQQLEGLPPQLGALLRHMLATDPSTRFASPAAVARALSGLSAALAPAPVAAAAPEPTSAPAAWRQPKILAAAAGGMLVLGLAAVLLLRGPDWDAKLAAGKAAEVRQAIEARAPADRAPSDELYLGHALDALEAYDEAFKAYARAAARGAVDDRARDFVLGELDARKADDVIALLERWPDPSIDAALVRLAEDGDRNQRRNALQALTRRGQQGKVDLQKVGLRELSEGRSCDARKRGVRLLIEAGREPAALAAVQKARARGLDNLCMQRELEQAERAIQQRLQAR